MFITKYKKKKNVSSGFLFKALCIHKLLHYSNFVHNIILEDLLF